MDTMEVLKQTRKALELLREKKNQSVSIEAAIEILDDGIRAAEVVWTLKDSDEGLWGCSCSGEWFFSDGTPAENGTVYCPKCGGKIVRFVETETTGRRCRICGCTDTNCRACIRLTGEPCSWTEPDLCSACAEAPGRWCRPLDLDSSCGAEDAPEGYGEPDCSECYAKPKGSDDCLRACRHKAQPELGLLDTGKI